MPGVTVTTGAVAGPSAPSRAPGSVYFVVGLAERGPTAKAQEVTSFADYQRYFGAATTYSAMYDDLNTFFQEGGTRAIVSRVVGPAATSGALATPLQDTGTTPAATLNVSAANPGAWSSNVSVQVLAGSTTSTFRFQVFYSGFLAEDYTNLHSPQEAVSRVNARSVYIALTDAGSATAAPQNNPAVLSNPVALAAGTDDRASATTTQYVSALTRFTSDMGDGAVGIPGMGASVHAGLIAHADANNRVALLTAEKGADKNTLIGYAAALDAKRAGLFGPWIQVPDGFGGTKAISPEGFVAAARAKACEVTGPWKAAAGQGSAARFLVAPNQAFTAADSNDMDAAKVNVIRTIAGSVRLYGWRSLSADTDNWGYLTGSDVVNRVVVAATRQLEPYVFGVIDSSGHLLSQVAGTLVGIVQPIAASGGLFARYAPDGTQLDPGYSVDTSSSINPVASLAQNQVLAKVGVRISPTAALVQLTVTKAAVTAAL